MGGLGSEHILRHRKRHHIIKTKAYLRTLLDVYVHLEALAPHSRQSPNKSSEPICIIFLGLRQRWKQRQRRATAATSKLLLENQPAATKSSCLLLVEKCRERGEKKNKKTSALKFESQCVWTESSDRRMLIDR